MKQSYSLMIYELTSSSSMRSKMLTAGLATSHNCPRLLPWNIAVLCDRIQAPRKVVAPGISSSGLVVAELGRHAALTRTSFPILPTYQQIPTDSFVNTRATMLWLGCQRALIQRYFRAPAPPYKYLPSGVREHRPPWIHHHGTKLTSPVDGHTRSHTDSAVFLSLRMVVDLAGSHLALSACQWPTRAPQKQMKEATKKSYGAPTLSPY